MMLLPFTPTGNTVTLAVTTSSARAAIGGFNSLGGGTVLITAPAGGQIAFIAFGGSASDATVAAGVPILPGAVQAFTVGPGITHVAAITSTSTQTLYITPGQGV